jgi:hypothetical protein
VKLSWKRNISPLDDGCWWRKKRIIKGLTDKIVTVEIVAGVCVLVTIFHAEAEKDELYRLHMNRKRLPELVKSREDTRRKNKWNKGAAYGDRWQTLNSRVLDISLNTIPHVSCPVTSGTSKALKFIVGLVCPKMPAYGSRRSTL